MGVFFGSGGYCTIGIGSGDGSSRNAKEDGLPSSCSSTSLGRRYLPSRSAKSRATRRARLPPETVRGSSSTRSRGLDWMGVRGEVGFGMLVVVGDSVRAEAKGDVMVDEEFLRFGE